ncbi:F-box/FBD/LRR-repeat protein At3g14710-like [Vigna umbellata]|uniref:F-box/FBD/LRR-repeat protein At3g14710-like n=1 Tax=Vigna umbellata TaxID=87088 RepID=UPI001F5E9DBF|nr:F-box/FBD/LRR-repeat protein At3g14710-like [Vigna umbellata]
MSGSYIYSSKQKHLKRTKSGERISELPESLISCIFSFLPTKDAVRTSVLSKTWVYRWTSITKLDIHDNLFFSPKKRTRGKQNFVNFVYRVLLLTTPSSFSLVLVQNQDVALFNIWISNILIKKVKNLRIVTHFEMSFPAQAFHFLFQSFCLEELVLNMVSCAITVTKTYVYFGQLKVLKLSGVLFTHDSVSDFNLSLPVLKVFETTNCSWLKAKRVSLEVPQLESVIIVEDNSSSYATNNCAVEFSVSHLKHFTYRGYDSMSHFFKLLDPSSASNSSLTITVSPCEKKKDTMIESRVFVLLKQFRKMKCLKLDGLQELAKESVANLPLFGMLSHLDLGFVTGDLLLGLLLKSPVLRTLVLKGISIFDMELLNSAAVPECLTSTLQVVKFGSLKGFEHELCVAKFVMENALMLERMSFSIVYWQRKSKVLEEFKEKLFSYKKAFSCAIIDFSHD